MDDLRELVDELWAPERLSAAGIGPTRRRSARAVDAGLPGRRGSRGMIRVAVAGAAGRMGQAVCAAVEGADDLELTGRADPALGMPLADVLDGCDVVVDFTRPDTGARQRARRRSPPGVHVVIGTTGFDLEALRAAAAGGVARTPSSRRTSRSAPC